LLPTPLFSRQRIGGVFFGERNRFGGESELWKKVSIIMSGKSEPETHPSSDVTAHCVGLPLVGLRIVMARDSYL
jgi:hypothetical protein